MTRSICISIISFALLISAQISYGKSIDFDLLAATPVGSWQLREDIETNHKGKQRVSRIRSSLVGSETRNGEKHFWVEMAMESFKVKKSGKRKQEGKRVIMKSLIPASLFSADPENIMNNLRGFGVETIMQTGNEEPMRMNTDGMMAGMMSAMQADINYDFEPLGSEQVSLESGTYDTTKIQGSGTVEMKVMFKKMKVESDSTVWLSPKVPFGTVKIEGSTNTNGKTSTNVSELLEFGLSGAVSEITQEPVDMPEMPKMKDLFGG